MPCLRPPTFESTKPKEVVLHLSFAPWDIISDHLTPEDELAAPEGDESINEVTDSSIMNVLYRQPPPTSYTSVAVTN
jgi:hypothetical protein